MGWVIFEEPDDTSVGLDTVKLGGTLLPVMVTNAGGASRSTLNAFFQKSPFKCFA